MSGSACGPGCGYCGACTAAWERDAPDSRDIADPYDGEREAAEDRADAAQETDLQAINDELKQLGR